MSGDGFTLLSGIEVDILEDGALDQEPDLLDELDVVVASAHSKLRMERGPMTRRLVAAASDPRVDVLGHVTGRLVEGSRGTRPPSTFDAEAVFERVRRERRRGRDQLPPGAAGSARRAHRDRARARMPLLDRLRRARARSAVADRLRRASARSEPACPPERIVTTWPLDAAARPELGPSAA